MGGETHRRKIGETLRPSRHQRAPVLLSRLRASCAPFLRKHRKVAIVWHLERAHAGSNNSETSSTTKAKHSTTQVTLKLTAGSARNASTTQSNPAPQTSHTNSTTTTPCPSTPTYKMTPQTSDTVTANATNNAATANPKATSVKSSPTGGECKALGG